MRRGCAAASSISRWCWCRTCRPHRTPDARTYSNPRQLWKSLDHPLAREKSVALREIATLPFVLLDMDEHAETVDRYWSAMRLKPKVVFRTKSIEAVRSLVAQNVGVTTLSDLVFRPWSHDGGRIRRTRVSNAVPSMDIGLAYCRGTVRPQSTTAFAEALRSLAKTLTRESARAELGA